MGLWATQWLAAQLQLKPSTRARYESILRCHVLPTWTDVPLSAVTHADVSAWVTGVLASGQAPASVRQIHRVLSLVLSLAVLDGRLPRNPADKVRLPRSDKNDKRFLTRAQLTDLSEAAGNAGLAIRVLGTCGRRFGELAALRVCHVDRLRRRLLVAESMTK